MAARDEVAFDAEARLMATGHATAEGPITIVKGAPEAVLARCGADGSGSRRR